MERRMAHLDADVCLDLAHGLMPPGRAEPWLEHVSVCPACEERLRVVAADRERIQSRFVLVRDTSGWRLVDRTSSQAAAAFEPAGDESPGPGWRDFFRPPRLVWGSVGVAAALVLLFVLPRSDSGPELAQLPVEQDRVQLRAAEAAVPEDLLRGLDAYAAGDMDQARELLAGAKAAGSLDTVRLVYLGSALAHLGDFEGAVAVLEPLRGRTVPDPWGSEALWTLYVALDRARHHDRAAALLEELRDLPGPVGDRARAQER